MILQSAVLSEIVIGIQQNETTCFFEDVSRGSFFQCQFGPADQLDFPPVDIVLLSPKYQVLREEEVTANGSFLIQATTSGYYFVCVSALPGENEVLQRNVWIDIGYDSLVPKSVDTMSEAIHIASVTTDVMTAQKYSKRKFVATVQRPAESLLTLACVSSLLSVLSMWAIVYCQNTWVAAEIKRRL